MYWRVLEERAESDADTIHTLDAISRYVHERASWISFLAGGLMALVLNKYGANSTYDEAIEFTKKSIDRWFASRKPA